MENEEKWQFTSLSRTRQVVQAILDHFDLEIVPLPTDYPPGFPPDNAIQLRSRSGKKEVKVRDVD